MEQEDGQQHEEQLFPPPLGDDHTEADGEQDEIGQGIEAEDGEDALDRRDDMVPLLVAAVGVQGVGPHHPEEEQGRRHDDDRIDGRGLDGLSQRLSLVDQQRQDGGEHDHDIQAEQDGEAHEHA